MTEDLTICEAGFEDSAGIAEIYAHYVLESTATFETEPPDAVEIRRRISDIVDAGYPFLVTRDSTGRVLATGFAHRYGPRVGYRYSVETTIYVRPDCVGRGIGSGLLTALVEACEARGYRQAFAVIAASEPASVVLHARAGYRPVGTLTGAGWKHGQWIDVFLMQRQLGQGNETLPEDAGESLAQDQ
ncbi:GNAT family N-acetyltransferase [Novosphingobium beihaiensis]|uniref:N-acetyltransferase family protein n=1 Tax=Novosphingobium beihaiensis TaxID=2930389 RepID=A0ABT0BNF2_9SPHN|nr:GNAT family N-acetyltransferase [Novosphingobium beihaiensis]MCJ2186580.1 N-acetyltransferase family protein [Novosphingobium beihaiensis]